MLIDLPPVEAAFNVIQPSDELTDPAISESIVELNELTEQMLGAATMYRVA